MKILAKDGKALVTSGKAIISPTVGGTVNVSYDTIEPNRYSVDLDNNTVQLDLTGLVDGSHYICNIDFSGTALDSNNINNTGDVIDYNITVFSTGSEQHNYVVYSFINGFVYALLQYNSNLVLNLDVIMENSKNEYIYGMAYNITNILDSMIVSWD